MLGERKLDIWYVVTLISYDKYFQRTMTSRDNKFIDSLKYLNWIKVVCQSINNKEKK